MNNTDLSVNLLIPLIKGFQELDGIRSEVDMKLREETRLFKSLGREKYREGQTSDCPPLTQFISSLLSIEHRLKNGKMAYEA